MIEMINSKEQFEKEIKEGDVIVNFTATWCGPCKMFAPVLKQYSEATGKKVLKIDIDNFKEIAQEYGVASIPTTFAMNAGKKSEALNGFAPLDTLNQMFK